MAPKPSASQLPKSSRTMTRAEVAADNQNRTAQEAQPAPVQQNLPDLLSGKSLDDIIAERLKNKSAAQPAVSSSHSPRARAQLSAPAKTALRTAATQRALEELETQQNRLNRQRRALLWSQDNLPAAWLDSLEHDLKLNDIEPDHVVSRLKRRAPSLVNAR